jgi:choline dehydrogenase-like flavoprotein
VRIKPSEEIELARHNLAHFRQSVIRPSFVIVMTEVTSRNEMVYVIGSGPAGVAVAYALLKQGAEVTMLDAGLTLEQERSRLVDVLSHSTPDEWSQTSLSTLKGSLAGDGRVMPRKLSYGSDFPYRDVEGGMSVIQSGVDVVSSSARGGLSNVWGGAVLPYRAEDIIDWPLSVDDLAPHYRAAFELMPLAAHRDDLEQEFPLYAPHCASIRPSTQAKALMYDLDASREMLSKEGIRYGHARLAVQVEAIRDQGGCVYCAMCLYGCPRKLIYNSAQSIDMLQARQGFYYRTDVVVDRIVEEEAEVQLFCRHSSSQLQFSLRGERVYLAAGVLGTAKIILSSAAAYGRRLTVRGSQYFLLPLLRLKQTMGVARESLHTLAQIFLEMSACIPGGHPAHLQIYTYNDFYRCALEKRFGALVRIAGRRLSDSILGRLMVVQGYLHSKDSSAISVRLEGRAVGDELVLEAIINPQAKTHVRGISRKLFKCSKYLHTIPLLPLLQIGKPGEGSHVGGTFPMRHTPSELETDIFGRLTGMRKIHIVDASVFPSIPSTTITLSVMANAHRIGSLYERKPKAA